MLAVMWRLFIDRPRRGEDVRHVAGRRGEAAAARWLRRQCQYRLLARNVRRGHDEADLLMRAPDGAIIIVEVRSRACGARVIPEETVTPTKQRRLARLARRLITERSYLNAAVRFDVVAIDLDAQTSRAAAIRHYPDAFPMPRSFS